MGLLLRELGRRGGRMRYCLPNRHQRRRSAGRLGLGLLLAGGGAVLGPLYGLPLFALAGWLAAGGLRTIWSRRDVVIDLDDELLWVVQRRFLSWNADTTKLSEFTAVLLDFWHRDGASVTLYHPWGGHVSFGTTPSSADAHSLARRLSDSLGLPIVHPG